MGKKNKDEAPNPNGVVNRDILQRLNFLYQASTYLESISRQSDVRPKARSDPSIDSTEEVPADASGSVASTLPTAGLPKTQLARTERQRQRRVIQAADIGRGYVRAMRLIGQKTTVKMQVLSACDMYAI
jgi:ribonuclease P protein subunit RPR2